VKRLPKQDNLLHANPDNVLEDDDAWSFVLKTVNKLWCWTVMCRRTRHISAVGIVDRREPTGCRLWSKIPSAYRNGISYSNSGRLIRAFYPQSLIMQQAKSVDSERSWSADIVP